MVLSATPSLQEAVRLVAPGQPLRDGLDRVLRAKAGALVIVGDGPDVLAICSGGFLLDAEYSPQRLSELAKMDGAIILSSDASRIARANVHLLPDPRTLTSETGTRHRTAERVARSVNVPVIAASEEMSVITVYRKHDRHQIEPIADVLDRATQAIATLERYRNRLDAVLSTLTDHELDGHVTVKELALALQRAEMVRRLGEEVQGFTIELGTDGRLVELQLFELLEGIDRERDFLARDYQLPGLQRLARLSTDDLLDLDEVIEAAWHGERVGAKGKGTLIPKGYRVLARLPRLSDAAIENVAEHFGSLPMLVKATVASLTRVEGIGEVRARTIRDGLARIVEASPRTERVELVLPRNV
jgi:diadenylate cyclase